MGWVLRRDLMQNMDDRITSNYMRMLVKYFLTLKISRSVRPLHLVCLFDFDKIFSRKFFLRTIFTDEQMGISCTFHLSRRHFSLKNITRTRGTDSFVLELTVENAFSLLSHFCALHEAASKAKMEIFRYNSALEIAWMSSEQRCNEKNRISSTQTASNQRHFKASSL